MDNRDSIPVSGNGVSSAPSLTDLFLSFLKIGAFTFGGGWAMISIIEREIVDRHNWIEREEFLDLLALAQSLPGILAVNMAVAVGDKVRSRKGAIISAPGTIIPSFVLILCIAVFLTPDLIKNNRVLSSVFMGIRPAVVALIIAPVLNAAIAAKLTLKTVWIPILTALLISLDMGFASNPIVYIVLGASGGWLYFSWSARRLAQAKAKGGDRQ